MGILLICGILMYDSVVLFQKAKQQHNHELAIIKFIAATAEHKDILVKIAQLPEIKNEKDDQQQKIIHKKLLKFLNSETEALYIKNAYINYIQTEKETKYE